MKLAVPDMISNSYFPAEAAVALGFAPESFFQLLAIGRPALAIAGAS